MNKVELSFIIPAKNEEKSVEKLYKKILEELGMKDDE